MSEPSGVQSAEQVSDLLACAVLKTSIEVGTVEYAKKVRDYSIRMDDGMLFTFVDSAITWLEVVTRASPAQVLEGLDSDLITLIPEYVARLYPVLFPAQIMALEAGVTSDDNFVVSLPTSSGKTLIAELRIAASLARHPDSSALYVAPYRLLARQVTSSFRRGLVGHSVQDLASGFDAELDLDIDSGLADVVVCTPERLDGLLRLALSDRIGSAEALEFFERCGVVVFDELQMIGRVGRGPRFELLIARFRNAFPQIPFLGLSAASQGADDLSHWICDKPTISGARRPTGTIEVLWQTDGALVQRVEPRPTLVGNLAKAASALDAARDLVLLLIPQQHPVLAVNTSRVGAEGLARRLYERVRGNQPWLDQLTSEQHVRLGEAIEEISGLMGENHPLALYLSAGVAFHHAGVPTQALQQIELLASLGILQAVSATTTVAEGADLPFRSVVIPHLNFPGGTGRLERDLYMNIIGRAGRANVSMEGIVFVLGSDARTLRDVVRGSLWRDTTADRVQSRLATVPTEPTSIDDWSAFSEAQSQLLAWIGEGNSYVDDQSSSFASLSFAATQDQESASRVQMLFSAALADLAARDFVVAGSPFSLTESGKRARLTGLGAASVDHLQPTVSGAELAMRGLIGKKALDDGDAELIAALVFGSFETRQHSLAVRRAGAQSFSRLFDPATGELLQPDIALLRSWILGASFREIASLAPQADHTASLFGGTSWPKKTSDATEYIGKLTYAAAWTWSGIKVLSGDLDQELPAFIRQAIEFGVPSEAATRLISEGNLTRSAALAVTELAGRDWGSARTWLEEVDEQLIVSMDLSALDQRRLRGLARRVSTRMS